MPLDVALRGFGSVTAVSAHQLRHADLKATNTKAAPEQVKPATLDGVRIDGNRLSVTLAPASWNVIRVAAKAEA